MKSCVICIHKFPNRGSKMSREWSNGLFSCFEDFSTCKVLQHTPTLATAAIINYRTVYFIFSAGILAWFCPCYVFGKNAEQLGESCMMYALSQFVPLLDIFCRASVRGKIREQKGIQGSFIEDLLWQWFCPVCALTQEARVRVHYCNFTCTLFARSEPSL